MTERDVRKMVGSNCFLRVESWREGSRWRKTYQVRQQTVLGRDVLVVEGRNWSEVAAALTALQGTPLDPLK